jgi:uncharacterized membrane protein
MLAHLSPKNLLLVALLSTFQLLACAGPDSSPAERECKPGLPSEDACATATPSYSEDIAPLVEGRCLECHFAGNRQSSVVLETHTQLTGSLQLVETRVYRCQMPPSEAPALSATEREMLLQWLVCGAPDN